MVEYKGYKFTVYMDFAHPVISLSVVEKVSGNILHGWELIKKYKEGVIKLALKKSKVIKIEKIDL